MFGYEAIVGHVLIERADRVVAIPPRFVLVEVKLVAIGLGESHDVEPVPRPAFAVMRGAEQTLDDSAERARRIVAQERGYLRRSGREPGEIERDAPQQIALARGRGGGQLALGGQKRVDGIPRRAHGRSGIANRLE